MIGVLTYIVFHQFRTGRQFGLRTVDLCDSPTAISDITRADVPSSIVLYFFCDFSEMGMMLHDCYEVQVIKNWCPILETILDDSAIIGSWCGVGAAGVDGIMVVGESIKMGIILTVELYVADLFLEGT